MTASYFSTLAIFLVIDLVWLTAMVPRFYRPILGSLAAADASLLPAAIFYLLYPLGIVVFAVQPALKSGSLVTAALWGALFGFFTYATYDLTNHATLRNWSTILTIVDIAWGSILGAVSAAGGYWIACQVS